MLGARERRDRLGLPWPLTPDTWHLVLAALIGAICGSSAWAQPPATIGIRALEGTPPIARLDSLGATWHLWGPRWPGTLRMPWIAGERDTADVELTLWNASREPIERGMVVLRDADRPWTQVRAGAAAIREVKASVGQVEPSDAESAYVWHVPTVVMTDTVRLTLRWPGLRRLAVWTTFSWGWRFVEEPRPLIDAGPTLAAIGTPEDSGEVWAGRRLPDGHLILDVTSLRGSDRMVFGPVPLWESGVTVPVWMPIPTALASEWAELPRSYPGAQRHAMMLFDGRPVRWSVFAETLLVGGLDTCVPIAWRPSTEVGLWRWNISPSDPRLPRRLVAQQVLEDTLHIADSLVWNWGRRVYVPDTLGRARLQGTGDRGQGNRGQVTGDRELGESTSESARDSIRSSLSPVPSNLSPASLSPVFSRWLDWAFARATADTTEIAPVREPPRQKVAPDPLGALRERFTALRLRLGERHATNEWLSWGYTHLREKGAVPTAADRAVAEAGAPEVADVLARVYKSGLVAPDLLVAYLRANPKAWPTLTDAYARTLERCVTAQRWPEATALLDALATAPVAPATLRALDERAGRIVGGIVPLQRRWAYIDTRIAGQPPHPTGWTAIAK